MALQTFTKKLNTSFLLTFHWSNPHVKRVKKYNPPRERRWWCCITYPSLKSMWQDVWSFHLEDKADAVSPLWTFSWPLLFQYTSASHPAVSMRHHCSCLEQAHSAREVKPSPKALNQQTLQLPHPSDRVTLKLMVFIGVGLDLLFPYEYFLWPLPKETICT